MDKRQDKTLQRHVLAAFRMTYQSNRNFLAGIARYLKRNPQWQVTVTDNFTNFDSDSLAEAERNGFDGIITVCPKGAVAESAIIESRLPVAILGAGSGDCLARTRGIVFIRGKDQAIGILAARHLMSLGCFRSYAFIDSGISTSWSSDRFRGFARMLRLHNHAVVRITSHFAVGSAKDIEFIADRLDMLPKPIAVMAAYDNRAMNVLTACSHSNLAVPGQVAVIGVDDDTILCDFSRPSLTSINTHPIKKGEIAAEELDRLMRNPHTPAKTVFVPGADVVMRESTAPLVPSAHLVERALRFIEGNAFNGIRAHDVVTYLGVSRALADRRFRECAAGTIREAISKVRLAEVKRLLRETSMPIARITEQCGFADDNYAKRVFRKAEGMSMRNWRSGHIPSQSDFKRPDD